MRPVEHRKIRLPRLCRCETCVVLAALAAAVLTLAAAGNSVLHGDVAVTRWIQGIRLPGAAQVAVFGSWVGGSVVIIAVASAIALTFFATRHAAAGLLMVALTCARVATPALKAAAESPRPGASYIRVTDPAEGFGFPSGHVLGVVLVFGGLIYLSTKLIDRPWLRWGIQVTAGSVILATGFARVYDGVHWPSDVVGGYLWGALVLAAIVTLHRRAYQASPMNGRLKFSGVTRVWTRSTRTHSG
jgi:undecaprenyl-diphosphatase